MALSIPLPAELSNQTKQLAEVKEKPYGTHYLIIRQPAYLFTAGETVSQPLLMHLN